jgi:DNA-binding transcriptional MerR regulator
MDKLSIGRMAETNHVSVQTLRLYDRMNLLKPQYVDTNRYRYYNIKQSARLDMIQNLQMLGMSLKQIKELLEKQDFLAVQDFLKLKQRDLDFHIRELTMRKKAIERTLTNCQRYTASPRDGMIVTEFIPKRKIYYYDSGINFYDYGIETYEYILRELKQHILLHELSMAYFCNVGTFSEKTIRCRNLYQRRYSFLSMRISALPPVSMCCPHRHTSASAATASTRKRNML